MESWHYPGFKITHCNGFWDASAARFTPCALIYLAAVPLGLISILFLCNVFGDRFRPDWSRPFVPVHPVLQVSSQKNPPTYSIVLLALSVVGCVAHTIDLVTQARGSRWIESLLLLLSWVIVGVLLVVTQPRTCPASLALFYIPTAMIDISFITSIPLPKVELVCHSIAVAAALTSFFIILLMPMRYPSGTDPDVSSVGSTPTDQFRSPEDDLKLWQYLTVYWMFPMIANGKTRKLNEDDVWQLPYMQNHRQLFEAFQVLTGGIIGRVIWANAMDVVILTTLSLVDSLCIFASPVLLQQLLKVMEAPSSSSIRAAVTYATLSFIVLLIKTQEEMILLWYRRRCYERCRGEMIIMVYTKALSRKNISGKPNDAKEITENGHASPAEEPSKAKGWKSWIPWFKTQAVEKQAEEDLATMGKVMNLIRGDVYEIAGRFWEIPTMMDTFLGIFIGAYLTWALLGPSCFLAVFSVLIAQGITAFLTRYQIRWMNKRKIARDERLQVSSQYIEVIRHLRWYGWQSHWLENVLKVRQKELWVRVILHLWFILINVVNAISILMFPVIALATYTLLDGHELRIDIIFPALQIFNIMTGRLQEIPNIINFLGEGYVSAVRVQKFMDEPEKPTNEVGSTESPSITLENCSYCWPETSKIILQDVNLTIESGLTVIVGKVGTGKTALLQALLGEMDLKSGSATLPNMMVGYCAQTPWLQSMSIRDNILFFTPYNPSRYREVLDACELLPDMATLKNGDLSFIGENGVGLSGGQKARVALARAVYCEAPILFLDDPLSALDHSTAELIVKKLFSGKLLKDRTVVLVTHRYDLVVHIASQTLRIDNGTVTKVEKATSVKGYTEVVTSADEEEIDPTKPSEEANGVAEKFIEEEHRADRGVQARVYWTWIKAGKLKWWTGLLIAIGFSRFFSLFQGWFLKSWGEGYDPETSLSRVVSYGKSFWLNEFTTIRPTTFSFIEPFKDYPSPSEDVRPWILTFFFINLTISFTLVLFRVWEVLILYASSKQLFRDVMVRVSGATFRYYDVTPIGRLLNRLTSDMGTVDGNIIPHIQRIGFNVMQCLFCLAVIASFTPTFLFFTVILVAAFVYVFMKFLPVSQSLRRLEMTTLSPLFANFGELLQGLATVRAFHAQHNFQTRIIATVDKFQRMDRYYWAAQTWLAYRFSSLSAISTFVLTILALYSGLSPGLTAFMLITATDFVAAMRDVCRRYGELQLEFVAVERVEELLHIDQEPKGKIDPPASWPGFNSEIRFENTTIRYAPNLDPAVKDVTLTIPAGSTTAVMGRTGSGKSTLVSSILGIVRADSGSITIDGIDVSEVFIEKLRQRITFVAQEPVLFSGSVRHNMDPLEEYPDEECANALDRVCGRQGWTLETEIESGGRNISQGQRQLLGIARAVLRRSPIIIMDEATASIDLETSMEIQRILREEMKDSTVITIAHRLEAVRDADYAIVMDHGHIVYAGSADEMPQKGSRTPSTAGD